MKVRQLPMRESIVSFLMDFKKWKYINVPLLAGSTSLLTSQRLPSSSLVSEPMTSKHHKRPIRARGDVMTSPQATTLYEDVSQPPRVAWNVEEEAYQAEEGWWSTEEDVTARRSRREKNMGEKATKATKKRRSLMARGEWIAFFYLEFLPGIKL